MNDEQRFERTARTWLEDGPTRAPDQAVETALNLITTTPQERDLRVPWRFPHMTTFAKLAVAAVVVIAVGAVGLIALQPRGVPAVGSAPSVSPSPSISASPEASPSAAPPLSQTFTSATNAISVSYPAGWSTTPATEPWTGEWPNFGTPSGDFLYDPVLTDHLFIGLASQPLAGNDAGEWAADTIAMDDCTSWEPVTIDGAQGLIGVDCNAVAVGIDDRGYLIALHTSDDEAWLSDVYDRPWFEQFLATVDLRPEDAASASPTP